MMPATGAKRKALHRARFGVINGAMKSNGIIICCITG
jgi:hypothetical protein